MLRAYSRDDRRRDPRLARGEHLSSRRSPTRSRATRSRSRSRTRSAHAGESKYSLYKLIRLNFDLVTGFSVVPLQLFSLFGIFVALVSVGVYVVVIVAAHRRGRGPASR